VASTENRRALAAHRGPGRAGLSRTG